MPLIESQSPIGFVDLGHVPALNVSDVSATRYAAEPEIPREARPERPPGMPTEVEPPPVALVGAVTPAMRDLSDPTRPVSITSDISKPAREPGVIGAAFRQETLLGAALQNLDERMHGPIDETHTMADILKQIEGTPAERFPERFFASRGPEDTQRIKAKIIQEEADRETLHNAGWRGVAAAMAAQFLSPEILLPIAAPLRAARGADLALSVARVGGTGALAVAAQEAGLHALQETRTVKESLYNVAGGAILAGILGGAISSMTGRQFAKLSRNLEEQVLNVPPNAKDDAFGMGGFEDIKAAGAKKVEPLPPAELESAMGLEKALWWQGPVMRTMSSPLNSVKETGLQLFESVLGITRNADGVTTVPVSQAVETRVKTQWWARYGEAMRATDEEFNKYFFAKDKVRFAAARAAMAVRTGRSDKLTFKQFKEEVGRAARRFDKHDIPEVERAAKFWRAHYFDPSAEAAVKAGIFSEDIWKGAKGGTGGQMVADRPAWGTEAHTQLQQTQDMVEGISKALGMSFDPDAAQQAIEAIRRVNPDVAKTLMDAYAAYQQAVTPATARVPYWQRVQGAPQGQTFKTAKGSTYEVHADGTTTRNKAPRPEHPGEQGPQPRSQKTYYVKDPDELSLLQTQGGAKMAIEAVPAEYGGGIGVKYLEGKDAGKFEKRTVMPFRDTPEVGWTPVEVWEDGTRVHFGNRITEMAQAGQGAQHAAPVSTPAELLEALQRAFQGATTHPSAAPPAKLDELPAKFANEIWDDAGQSYLTRMPKPEVIMSRYKEFVGIITEHLGAAQQRGAAVLARLSKEGAAGKEVDNLAEFVSLKTADLEQIAKDIAGHYMRLTEGRMSFELPASIRGPLKARTLRIKDELIEEFLESDIETIGRYYTRTAGPEVELVRAFGDVDMTIPKANMKAEVDALTKHLPDGDPERQRLFDAKEEGIRDLEAMRDRLRGIYGQATDPTAMLPRVVRAVRAVNVLRMMGGMTLSALPDMWRIMSVHGVQSYFQDGIAPLITNLQAVKLAGREVQLAGTALDMLLDTRMMAIADVADDFGRYSKVERALQSLQSNYGIVSLMAPWNSFMKQWAGVVTMTNIVRAAQRVAEGRARPTDIEKLHASNINEVNAKRIAALFAEHGKIDGGVYLPHTQNWDTSKPGVQSALDAFRGAIAQTVDRIIVTPGQEKPLWFSTQLGKIMFQFRSFAFTSTQRVLLANLQQRDAGVMASLALMVGTGVMVEYFKNITQGKEQPKTLPQWISNAVDRSGTTGFLYEVNNFTEQFTGSALGFSMLGGGRPVSRYSSRNFTDAILGPTGGLIEDLSVGARGFLHHFAGHIDPKTGNRVHEKLQERHIRSLRRSLPYQNLFYWSWLFRQMEQSAVRGLGAAPDKPKQSAWPR